MVVTRAQREKAKKTHLHPSPFKTMPSRKQRMVGKGRLVKGKKKATPVKEIAQNILSTLPPLSGEVTSTSAAASEPLFPEQPVVIEAVGSAEKKAGKTRRSIEPAKELDQANGNEPQVPPKSTSKRLKRPSGMKKLKATPAGKAKGTPAGKAKVTPGTKVKTGVKGKKKSIAAAAAAAGEKVPDAANEADGTNNNNKEGEKDKEEISVPEAVVEPVVVSEAVPITGYKPKQSKQFLEELNLPEQPDPVVEGTKFVQEKFATPQDQVAASCLVLHKCKGPWDYRVAVLQNVGELCTSLCAGRPYGAEHSDGKNGGENGKKVVVDDEKVKKERREYVAEILSPLIQGLVDQLADLRSMIIKHVCDTIGVFATELELSFEPFADKLLKELLKLTGNKKAAMKDPAVHALHTIILHCHGLRSIEMVIQEMLTNKNATVVAAASSIVKMVCTEWDGPALTSFPTLTVAIEKGLGHANEDVRSTSRQSFVKLIERFSSPSSSSPSSSSSSSPSSPSSPSSWEEIMKARCVSAYSSLHSKTKLLLSSENKNIDFEAILTLPKPVDAPPTQ